MDTTTVFRKSYKLSPARLAACRANAKKSTGPKTERGKARSSLNGLKHGRYARKLPPSLSRARYWEALDRYFYYLETIRYWYGVAGEREEANSARLAAQVWCYWWRALNAAQREAKPGTAAESVTPGITSRLRIQLRPAEGIPRLIFGVQIRRPRRRRMHWRTAITLLSRSLVRTHTRYA